MATPAEADYDPRYLAGILFFNRRDFFEAHEVWEDLWHETSGPERRFIQALIQAAVALFHFGNGNVRGAARLYRSSLDYMKPYFPAYLGLDVAAFWERMGQCCAALLTAAEPPRDARPEETLMPTIVLEPAPEGWPDPEAFLPDEEDGDE
jgi:predicted metal-dependent hydrolase